MKLCNFIQTNSNLPQGEKFKVLIKKLVSIIGENSFYITTLRRVNINKTKIRANNEQYYRIVVSEFEKNKRSIYTYQLKSSKVLQVAIECIDSSVAAEEVKAGLISQRF